MQLNSWTLLLLVLVWLVSGYAGVSFLHQAMTEQSSQATRGWRKILRGIRFRFFFVVGIALILWVISGVVWVLFNSRSF